MDRVAELNVDNRIKKTDGKLFGSLRNVIWDKTNQASIETKLKLYTTLLRPSLLSGRNALCVEGQQLARLRDWENWILRVIFRVKDNASVWGLFANAHILPIEGHYHKSVLGLFYNAWLNKSNPATNLIKDTLEEKDGKGFWAVHLKKICERYRIPHPKELLQEDPPEKTQWRDYVDKKVKAYHEEKVNIQIDNMVNLKMIRNKATMDGNLEECLRSKYGGSNRTIQMTNAMIVGEFRNLD